jgi:A/G-specific adenine glycosylase
MLQQTRVETVIPYYKRWLQRFPSMETLAEAREEDVLLTWQGLGYYARARRLLWAARAVREEHGGSLPSSAAELQELPGVGEYTAGAVASMAFGEAVPAVDGNVRRVLARLYDLPSPAPAELRKLARGLVDPDRPGDFNQALMELGATVCQPRSPLCPSCPLQELCLARARDTVKERPARKTPRPVPQVEVAVVVALQVSGGSDGAGSEEGGEVVEEAAPAPLFFLSQRSGSGLLEGMWEFPGTEVGSGEGARNAALRLAGELGLHVVGEPRELDLVTHLFSHLKVRYRPFLFQVGGSGQDERGEWLELENLGRVPLSVAQLKIAEVTRKVVQDGWPGL